MGKETGISMEGTAMQRPGAALSLINGRNCSVSEGKKGGGDRAGVQGPVGGCSQLGLSPRGEGGSPRRAVGRGGQHLGGLGSGQVHCKSVEWMNW